MCYFEKWKTLQFGLVVLLSKSKICNSISLALMFQRLLPEGKKYI